MSESPNLDDVQARRAEIKAELMTVREQEKVLASEDQELEIAERVLLRLAGVPETPPPMEEALGAWNTDAGWRRPIRPLPENGTIEETISWLLEGAVDPWATAIQIQAALTGTLKRPVPMSTVSPTLTMMKNKGVLVRDGLLVALASRINNEKAAVTPIVTRRL